MKTVLFFHFQALIILSVCAQSQDAVNKECKFELRRLAEGAYELIVNNYDTLARTESCFHEFIKDSKTKPDGKVIVKDKSGNIRTESHYEGGKINGDMKYWYKTGNLEYLANWDNDTLINYIWYFESGLKRFESIDNEEIVRSWYDNGQLKREENYLTLELRDWYQNGQIKREENLIAGEIKEWHANGTLKMEGDYKLPHQSIVINVWTYYDSKGNIEKKVYYKNKLSNRSDNTWKKIEYFKNDKVVKTETK